MFTPSGVRAISHVSFLTILNKIPMTADIPNPTFPKSKETQNLR